jgi:hypothetical protein
MKRWLFSRLIFMSSQNMNPGTHKCLKISIKKLKGMSQEAIGDLIVLLTIPNKMTTDPMRNLPSAIEIASSL